MVHITQRLENQIINGFPGFIDFTSLNEWTCCQRQGNTKRYTSSREKGGRGLVKTPDFPSGLKPRRKGSSHQFVHHPDLGGRKHSRVSLLRLCGELDGDGLDVPLDVGDDVVQARKGGGCVDTSSTDGDRSNGRSNGLLNLSARGT